MIALVAGATGLTGSEVVNILIQDNRFERVYVLSRGNYESVSKKITPIFFEKNINEIDELPGPTPDTVFCCLGTTIKKAGSQKAFRFVDVELVNQLIERSEHWGTRCFVLQSSVGAGQKTGNFIYNAKPKPRLN